jgi:hypothetical protein
MFNHQINLPMKGAIANQALFAEPPTTLPYAVADHEFAG